jgi:hypothetical protein
VVLEGARAWFVTIDGSRICLGVSGPKAGSSSSVFTEADGPASAAAGLLSNPSPRSPDAFLEWVQRHRSAETYEWYRYRLERFVRCYPDLRGRRSPALSRRDLGGRLRPLEDVPAELSPQRQAVPEVGQPSRGYIDANPIADLEVPSRRSERTSSSRRKSFEHDAGLVRSPNSHHDLMIVTWETGCRPQESLRVEARHVDVANSAVGVSEVGIEDEATLTRVVYLTEPRHFRSPAG